MSLLHSFYCWGHMAVVILSTVYFALVGIENWRILALLWAAVPIVNGIAFLFVPIASPESTGQVDMSLKNLLRSGQFWLVFLMMICSGASEQGISQWASAFAENALRVPKAVGDLAGPLSFAFLMGISRAIYAKFSARLPLEKTMLGCGILCALSYLMASLSPSPVLGFVGCALCGLSCGIMWPGTFNIAAGEIKGGTAMFALLALAGDVGCSAGPTLVGLVSDRFGGDLKPGILAGILFPLGLVAALAIRKKRMVHSAEC